MRHRLQNRLQVTTVDFMGAAIGNSWEYPMAAYRLPAFGISTRRTGGGKQFPEDMRFQSL
ncbi:MAG TPA: hypothetical protein VKC66_36200 [Xanthobacteraceae bacterium]|nr:hypothetical protein [Xanthobacteraceae bacterium]